MHRQRQECYTRVMWGIFKTPRYAFSCNFCPLKVNRWYFFVKRVRNIIGPLKWQLLLLVFNCWNLDPMFCVESQISIYVTVMLICCCQYSIHVSLIKKRLFFRTFHFKKSFLYIKNVYIADFGINEYTLIYFIYNNLFLIFSFFSLWWEERRAAYSRPCDDPWSPHCQHSHRRWQQ